LGIYLVTYAQQKLNSQYTVLTTVTSKRASLYMCNVLYQGLTVDTELPIVDCIDMPILTLGTCHPLPSHCGAIFLGQDTIHLGRHLELRITIAPSKGSRQK
jgi:hypothetical protein